MQMYDRQIRVFGKQGQRALQRLIVGIVGLGGIGSLIFILLVRLGVLRFIIIDPDVVEESNLNRLVASTLKDAKEKTPKVTMLKRYAAKINPRIKITAIQKSIHEKGSLNHIKRCDVIFGCTDNQSTRWVLNKFSVEHLIPYFDTGTGIQANSKQNIEHAGGQVRIVIPGMGCLNCINGIDISIAQQEMMPESDRQIAIQLGYIAGADIHAPAVASLNGVVANLAVTEFMAFVTDFRPVQRYVFYDFMNTGVVCYSFEKNPNCFTCSKTGSFAIGDNGKPLPVDMLLHETKTEENVKGAKMNTQNITINRSLEALLAKVREKGFEIEGSPESRWFMVKNITTGKPFNKHRTKVMVKFPEGSTDPIILVPENLAVDAGDDVCPNFLGKTTYISGWKSLCPHMISEVGDELFEFILYLTGLLAKPSLCGLMGCEGKDRINRNE